MNVNSPGLVILLYKLGLTLCYFLASVSSIPISMEYLWLPHMKYLNFSIFISLSLVLVLSPSLSLSIPSYSCVCSFSFSNQDLEAPAPKLTSGEWLIAGSFNSEMGMHTSSACQNSVFDVAS